MLGFTSPNAAAEGARSAPPTSTTSPAIRRPRERLATQALRAVHRRHPARRPRDAREGLPRQRHADQAGAARALTAARVPAPRGRRCAGRSRPSSRPCACSAADDPDARTTGRPGRAVWQAGTSGTRRSGGRPERLPRHRRGVAVGERHARALEHPPSHAAAGGRARATGCSAPTSRRPAVAAARDVRRGRRRARAPAACTARCPRHRDACSRSWARPPTTPKATDGAVTWRLPYAVALLLDSPVHPDTDDRCTAMTDARATHRLGAAARCGTQASRARGA